MRRRVSKSIGREMTVQQVRCVLSMYSMRTGPQRLSTLELTSGCEDDFVHVLADLGYRAGHLLAEDVAELGEGVTAALELLVVSHDQLDELAGVDVRVARVLDVLDDFQWEMRGQSSRSLAQ